MDLARVLLILFVLQDKKHLVKFEKRGLLRRTESSLENK